MKFQEWFKDNADKIDEITIINGIHTDADHLKEMFREAFRAGYIASGVPIFLDGQTGEEQVL